MSIESQFILSFYKEIATINKKHAVTLVQHVETQKLYVKKVLSSYNIDIYHSLKACNFPHIPVIEALVEDEDHLIVIEEYINGQNLEEILKERLFSQEETCNILLNLCQILKPLHQHHPKIIHRDIKPSNLILDNQGRIFLVDFDASKSFDPKKERDTVLMGTEDYAAPEQYGFQQSTERTDIFAIGVLTCKLLSGKLPSEKPFLGSFESIVKKCIAIDPQDRYSSVTALASAIEKVGRKSFALPGFHKKRPRNMILASLWYLFIIFFASTLKLTDTANVPMTGFLLHLNQAAIATAFFLWTLYFANYRNFRDRFPLKPLRNPLLNWLRIAFGAVLLFVLCALVTAIIEGFL